MSNLVRVFVFSAFNLSLSLMVTADVSSRKCHPSGLFMLDSLNICGVKRHSTWLYVLRSYVYHIVLADTLRR